MIVRRKLAEARRRLVLQQFVCNAAWALVAGFSAAVVFRGLGLFQPRFYAMPGSFYLAVLVVPFLAVGFLAVWKWRADHSVATAIDARAQTHDRFVTILKLDESGAFAAAVRREVEAFVASFRIDEHLRLGKPGKNLLWVLAPLALFGAVEGIRHWRAAEVAPELKVAQALVDKARRAAEKHPGEEYQDAAKDLEKAREELAGSPEPMRDALRSLAELEQKLSASSASQGGLDNAELSALADALAAQNAGLASDLRSGNNGSAAEEIAAMNPDELARALEQAARHRENTRLRELSKQGAAQARSQLAAMMRSQGAGGKNDAERRKFLSELSDARTSTSPDQQESGEGKGQSGDSREGEGQAESSGSADSPPGMTAGSEKDKGRGSDLAGEAEAGDRRGNDDFISGRQGEGSSLVEIFRAAGNDDPKAAQAYRSAYQAARGAALDAVEQEEIPSGSRLLVRRYFEAIRPKE